MLEYTILIVDYDPRSLESLRGMFEALGHRVEVSTDGLAAVDQFDQVRPDLTLIEFMLPKKSGLEVCSVLRATEAGQTAPILIMSSRFRSRQYRSEARHRYHADDFLEKPIDAEKVAEILARYLPDRENGESEVVAQAPAVEAATAETPAAEAPVAQPSPAAHAPIVETAVPFETTDDAEDVPATDPEAESAAGTTAPSLQNEITDRIDALLGGDL